MNVEFLSKSTNNFNKFALKYVIYSSKLDYGWGSNNKSYKDKSLKEFVEDINCWYTSDRESEEFKMHMKKLLEADDLVLL